MIYKYRSHIKDIKILNYLNFCTNQEKNRAPTLIFMLLTLIVPSDTPIWNKSYVAKWECPA